MSIGYSWTGRSAVVLVDEESVPAFREMVQRATNLWPDAPPEIKEFADMVTVGHVQQKYEVQKQLSPRETEGVFDLEDDKKSVNYNRCKYCGEHLKDHEARAGNNYCPSNAALHGRDSIKAIELLAFNDLPEQPTQE
jgi:hypothetical protein